MKKVGIVTLYSTCVITNIELPPDKTEKDIEDVGVKWGTITVLFKDGSEITGEEPTPDVDSTDWKRPDSVVVRKTTKDGGVDFSDNGLVLES